MTAVWIVSLQCIILQQELSPITDFIYSPFGFQVHYFVANLVKFCIDSGRSRLRGVIYLNMNELIFISNIYSHKRQCCM
jgi:hypothetical protein